MGICRRRAPQTRERKRKEPGAGICLEQSKHSQTASAAGVVVNIGGGAVSDGGGLCEWRAVHRAGGRRVGLSRGSVTLRVGGKSLEGAQQSHGDVAWLPFPQARSGVCVENALRGPWADSGAPFRRLVQ